MKMILLNIFYMRHNLKNITVKQYSQKPDIRYSALLSSMKPKNLFAGKVSNVGELPYLDVINWYTKIGNIKDFNGMVELFCFVFNIEEQEFWSENLVNYFAAKNFIEQKFKTQQEAEAKLLKGSGVDKLKWKAAGGESLKMFSPVSPLDDLAQRYGGDPFEYGRKPYNRIMYLLTMITRKNTVSRNYQKQMNEK